MIDVTIVLPIEPEAKGRPQAFVNKATGHAGVFTPKKTQTYEARVREAAALRLPDTPIEGPLRVEIVFVLPRPQGLMRRSDPDGLIWHTKRPDTDNLVKAVTDALSRHWRDDAQICALHAYKCYAERKGLPRLVVHIESLDGMAAAIPQWALTTLPPTAPVAAPNATPDLFSGR